MYEVMKVIAEENQKERPQFLSDQIMDIRCWMIYKNN